MDVNPTNDKTFKNKETKQNKTTALGLAPT